MARYLVCPLALLLAGFSLAETAPAEPKQQPRRMPPFLKDTPKQFIRRFDKNKDGFLTRDELPPFLARNFDLADTNGDGKLDAQEVAALLRVLRQRFAKTSQPAGDKAAVERIVNNILQRMDSDKDGRISRQEARANVAKLFDQLDTNKDGFLDRQELRRLAARRLASQRGNQGAAREPARPNRTRPDFDALDLDADGRLTRAELKDTPFLAVFDQIDANKDGKIDRKEFEAYLKKTAR